MSTSSKFVLAIVLLVGASAGFYFYQQGGGTETDAKGKQAAAAKAKGGMGAMMRMVTVETVESRLGRIQERVLLTGALKPKEQVDVTPKTAGRVTRLVVNVGDIVRQGTLIAELEDEELQQQVNRAKASINVASASLAQRQAELANAKLNLSRSETLLKDGLIPKQQFETEKTSVQVLEAQVDLARAQRSQADAELRELNIRLEQTKIYSPINGQIAQRFVDMGALVGPSTPLVRVVNIATLVTNTSVPESDIGKMRVGGGATIRVDAMPNEKFQGRVARISPVLDPATRTATAEIEIPNPGMQLRAEMFVRVEMDLQSHRESVLVPRESLVYRGDSSGVYVVENGKHTFRYIETGLTQDENVEVLANLDPGTVVVAKGASMLREGDRMEIVAGPGATGSRKGGKPGANADGAPANAAGSPTSNTASPKPSMQARQTMGGTAGAGAQ